MLKMLKLMICLCTSFSCFTQSIDQLSLIDTSMVQYVGAFRLSSAMHGISSLDYAEGPITYNPDNHSLFIIGHPYQQALAEFYIPDLKTGQLSTLNIALPIQEFDTLLYCSHLTNNEALDRIGGMYYIGDANKSFLVNAYEYYDAPGDNTTSTFMLEGINDITNADFDGIESIYASPAHLAGWISEIPEEYKEILGGNLIFGHSSGIPIISRASVGPSAFVMNLDLEDPHMDNLEMVDRLLDFSLSEPLHEDLSNNSLDNDLWTHLSKAAYGFIVPGTKTYFTIGKSGGHESGVCYKCTQSDDNLCGGYCTPDAEDNYSYYWLWNMDDLLAVKAGSLDPDELRPYDYGQFTTRFGNSDHMIFGATFDNTTRRLYLSIEGVDTLQGNYQFPPVIEVYQFPGDLTSTVVTSTDNIQIFPNPTSDYFIISGNLDHYHLKIINTIGQVLQEKDLAGNQESIDISMLPNTLLLVQISHTDNNSLFFQKILKSN